MTTSLARSLGIPDCISDEEWSEREGSITTGNTTMMSAPPTQKWEFRQARPDVSIRVVAHHNLPAWVEPVIKALADLLTLPVDWDSYGASRIAPSHVGAALDVLQYIMKPETPVPAVVPTNRGGVQLEWHTGGIDLEIETLSTQRWLISFECAAKGIEWEKEVVGDLSPLAKCIDQLS